MKKRYILPYNYGHKEEFFRISGKKIINPVLYHDRYLGELSLA
jgi:hypothetical protein